MGNYILRPYRKGGKTLYPTETYEVEDLMQNRHDFSLTTHYARTEYGKVLARYRLHTKEPYLFLDTMEYDIKCPRCGNVLRLCGNPYDAHEHGLYKCRRCDEGGR